MFLGRTRSGDAAVTLKLRPTPARVRRPLLLVRLFVRVVLDMLRSNVRVARAILRDGAQRVVSLVRAPAIEEGRELVSWTRAP